MVRKILKREELSRKLQQDIYLKELRAGDRIGSVRRLAMRYSTTPLTISRLLTDLVTAGVLYRDGNGACRVLNDPPEKPHLGYAGEPLLPSGMMDCLMQNAVKRLFGELDQLGAPPQIIGYHELRDPETAMRRLKNINGLILHDSFLDEYSCKVLNQLNIPIVRVGQTVPKYSEFSSSEVVQYFDPALKEFARYCDIKSYRRIVIVHPLHWNGIKLAEEIKLFLCNHHPEVKVETIQLEKSSCGNAELQAFGYFQKLCDENWQDTLIISGSGYSSRGICRAFSGKMELPDILSIDNLDSYEKCTFFEEPYLTAIDRNMGEIFREAAKLLVDQVRSGDERKLIIKVPAKLVIRKSIRHVNSDWKE